MIANFTLMGSLYKHREYSTLATEWNTYPWVLGADNPIEQSIELDDFYSSKTIREAGEDSLSVLLFNIESFAMTASLIRIDNLGNFGKAVDNPPNLNTPPIDLIRNFSINDVFLYMNVRESLLIRDSNSENMVSQNIGLKDVSLILESKQTLLIEDSNSEGSVTQNIGVNGVFLFMEIEEG